jgi:hypothetical protein
MPDYFTLLRDRVTLKCRSIDQSAAVNGEGRRWSQRLSREIASANTMPSHREVRHLGHLLAERFFGDLLLRVDMSSWAAAGALTAP